MKKLYLTLVVSGQNTQLNFDYEVNIKDHILTLVRNIGQHFNPKICE